MAYWRAVLKGSIGGIESWSTSTAFGIVGLSPDVPDQSAADGILANLLAYTTTANVPTSFKSLLSSGSWISGWRLELRSEDESILSISEGSMGSPVFGTSTPTKTPQDACVISLRTSTPGARGRGRMYFPAMGAALNATFQLNAPTAANVAADAKTWLNAIKGRMDAYYTSIAAAKSVAVSVRSATDHVCRDVNQIQVGSILDTQRRRRDAIPESYSSVAFP
jgi:hypothetical protein